MKTVLFMHTMEEHENVSRPFQLAIANLNLAWEDINNISVVKMKKMSDHQEQRNEWTSGTGLQVSPSLHALSHAYSLLLKKF